MEGSIPTFQHFFQLFFIWSVNCSSHFFSPFLLVSKLYELNLRFQKFKHEFIFERFQYCYLSKVRFVLFVPIQTFFWSANCTILVCKLCLLFQTILDLWPVLMLEIFSCWDIKKGQFQFLVSFLVVFFWSVNCTKQVCISSYILNMGNSLFEGFQYLVFSVFKYLKFTFPSNFSCSGNAKVLVCKLYTPGL